MGSTVRMVPEGGGPAVEVPIEDAQVFADTRGYVVQSAEQQASQAVEAAREDYYSSPTQVAKAVATAGARGITGGLSDLAARAVGGDDARRELEALRAYNPTLSTVTEIGASLLPTGVGGLASRAGTRIAGTGGGAVSQLVRAGVSGTVEGTIIGAGQGVSEVALSDKGLSVDQAMSTIGSAALFGGLTGGGAGVAAKGLELGLSRAKRALDDAASRGVGQLGEGADDLARLDRKGLKAAEKTEIEAIESARVPERAKVADEIKAFRQELKDQKVWLATKGIEDAEIKASAIGKRTLKADKTLDRLLDDPRALAENPKSVMSALRVQEAALDDLVNKHGARLRTLYAADQSGTRLASLENASKALEKNRALQSRISELSAKPASSRLDAIAEAAERLSSPKQPAGLGGALGDAAMSYGMGAIAGVPILGTVMAAGRIAAPILKKLGANSGKVADGTAKAVQTFLHGVQRAAPYVPIAASKVLSEVRYAPGRKGDKQPKAGDLATAFRSRAAEIRSQVQPTPDGGVQMHPTARAQMAAQLAPIRAVAPLLADRMETAAARRIEFLASKLPRRPEAVGMAGGPDNWHPSDMEMRTFARYAEAVENPQSVMDRLTTGDITPEDAEAIRTVYPEMYADMQQQIVSQIPSLREALPYHKRLALSIFSDIAVDPSMDPAVLAVLQGSFEAEPETNGGIQAPRPQPAFGSVKRSVNEATPAQQRGSGG